MHACLNIADTEGIVLHRDLGSRFTSQVFENHLASRGILHSFSRKGNPYDNACIESFHSVLKKEEIYRHTYQDSMEARRAIFEYIVRLVTLHPNKRRMRNSKNYRIFQLLLSKVLTQVRISSLVRDTNILKHTCGSLLEVKKKVLSDKILKYLLLNRV